MVQIIETEKKELSLVKNMGKPVTIYGGGSLISRAIPFVLLPVLTRFLTPADYGILATFIAIFGVVHITIYMGVTDAVMRAFFDKDKDGFCFPEYVFNGFVINTVIFVGIISVLMLLKGVLVKWIPISFGFQLLIPTIGYLAAIYKTPLKLLVAMKKAWFYSIFCVSETLIEVALAVILIVFLGFDWQGRVWGLVVSKFLLCMAGLYFLLKHKFIQTTVNKKYISDIFSYGSPVFLHSVGFVVIAAIDRFFINAYLDVATTGIYSVSYSICSLIAFAAGALALSWSPVFYEKLGGLSKDAKKKLVKSTYLYFALLLVSIALFIKLIPFILNILVGEKFLGAGVFVSWLALGFGFHSMYTMMVMYIFYEKKTHILGKIAIVTIVLSFVSNFVLIKINGAIGVAQATCLVFLVRFLLVWYSSNQVYPMPWLSFMRRVQRA